MAVTLHRCPNIWGKIGGHPCRRVQKELDDQGIADEVVPGPGPGRKSRAAVKGGTGQPLYPAIQFEDGSWYREESADMAQTIRAGKLMDKARGSAAAASG